MTTTEPLRRKPRGIYTQETVKAAAEKTLGCRLLSSREVARHYDVTVHQVMNWVHAGRIPRPIKFRTFNYFIASQHIACKKQMQAVMRAEVKQVLRVAA